MHKSLTQNTYFKWEHEGFFFQSASHWYIANHFIVKFILVFLYDSNLRLSYPEYSIHVSTALSHSVLGTVPCHRMLFIRSPLSCFRQLVETVAEVACRCVVHKSNACSQSQSMAQLEGDRPIAIAASNIGRHAFLCVMQGIHLQYLLPIRGF